MRNLFHVRLRKEIETQRRIRLSVAAWAYENADPENGIESSMSDADFDRESRMVDLSVNTDRPDLDAWFRANFDPSTGSWIGEHPEIERVEKLYWHLENLKGGVAHVGYYSKTN